MITYTQGNLLEAPVEAVVNTVNTVGVMGKGIALMFKDRFPEAFLEYKAACKNEEVKVGQMFLSYNPELTGPNYIIHFPTKQHWRNPTKQEWVKSGLVALKELIIQQQIKSIAIPPLGCGNGGLKWEQVKPMIVAELGDLDDVEIVIYEPTTKYQNVAKKKGVQKLTPARAMVAEMIRSYGILGIACSLIEVQKLAWFLERFIESNQLDNPLNLEFTTNRYGPYSNPLHHLLDHLDGSYLECDKRLSDAKPLDEVSFKTSKRQAVDLYLATEAKDYGGVINEVKEFIEGFESPLGMEALSTVDWLYHKQGVALELDAIREGIKHWQHDASSAQRKTRIFSDSLIQGAIERIRSSRLVA